jgi:hypothetical protein
LNPVAPTFSEAVLSFGPLILMFLAALAIVCYYVSKAYRKARSKTFASTAREKAESEDR